MGGGERSSNADRPIRVLVADDHPVVRTGLVAVLAQEADLELVAEAENGERAVALYREHRPDVCLMDLRMPGPTESRPFEPSRLSFPERASSPSRRTRKQLRPSIGLMAEIAWRPCAAAPGTPNDGNGELP